MDIGELELKVNSNAKKASNGLNALSKSLEKLKGATSKNKSLENVSKGLDKLNKSVSKLDASKLNALKNASGSLNKLSRSTDKASKSFGRFAIKAGAALIATKKLAVFVGKSITESNKYIENMNLFYASMGEYAPEAQRFAESVGEVMGIDPGEWMRNQGVFMTLAEGFGVAADRSAKMSKNLTQLGYDLSSFYNISVADSMQKLQSGLAGELEPLTLAA